MIGSIPEAGCLCAGAFPGIRAPSTARCDLEPVGLTCTLVSPFLAILYHIFPTETMGNIYKSDGIALAKTQNMQISAAKGIDGKVRFCYTGFVGRLSRPPVFIW